MRMRQGLAYLLTVVMIIGMLMGVPAKGSKVIAVSYGMTVTGGQQNVDYTYTTDGSKTETLTIKTGTTLEVSGYSLDNAQIIVDSSNNEGVNLVLNGLDIYNASGACIQIPDGYTKDVNITLKGNENNMKSENQSAVIQKNDGTAGTEGILTFLGDGSLKVTTAATQAAAIGGSKDHSTSNIQFGKTGTDPQFSGTVTVEAKSTGGAAIGGGLNGDGSNIVVNSGNVKASIVEQATTNPVGAAIGGGGNGDGNNIMINGGTVTANAIGATTTNCAGAGIGGGMYGSAENIIINGGTVTAIGDTNTYGGAAGIGAGAGGFATGIQINGGIVTATGNGLYGAGIGTSEESGNGTVVDVTITGGTIIATGSGSAPGIGSGRYAGANVYISGGTIQAIAGPNAYNDEESGYADKIGVGGYQNVINQESLYPVNVVYSSSNNAKVSCPDDGYIYKNASGSILKDTVVTPSFVYSTSGEPYTGYGTKDMKTGPNGELYLYLIDGVELLDPSKCAVDFNVVFKQNGEKLTDTTRKVTLKDTTNSSNVITSTTTDNATYTFKGTVSSGTYALYVNDVAKGNQVTLDGRTIEDIIFHTCTVSVESTENGTIETKEEIANEGENFPFVVKPAPNYTIKQVSYKIGNGTYQTLQGTNGSYTIPGNVITDEISIKAEFTESKGTAIDMSGMTWNYTTPYYYKNESYAVQLSSELPTGVKSVSYTNNVQSDIGTYTATAEFTCLAGYYAEPMSCTWEIKEYTPTLNLKYNDSTTLKDWYTGAVVITEENHLIAESPTATEFVESIELSDNKAKTLYFKHKTDGYITTEGKNVSVNIDNVAPTGSIVLDGASYSEINAKESKICHLADNQITINATDSNSEVAKVEYATSNESFTTQDAIEKAGLTWQMGTPSFVSGTALYVRIKDKAGNARYISTPVITNDALPPTMKATVSNVTASSADYSIEFSENSNYAYMLVKDTETKPSTAEVIQKNGITGSGTLKTGTFNDLAPNTKYSICAVSDDGMKTLSGSDNKNQTDVEVLTSFTTAEESLDNIVFKYNGSTTLMEWYRGSVEISADGYFISDSKSGGFGDTYTITSTTSDTVLYLKNKKWNTVIPTGKVVEVKIDNTKPTGSVGIDGMTYNTLNVSENKVCHLSSTELDFASSDKESGIAKVEYALSTQLLTTESAVATAITSWSTETPEFASGKAIYVRITDIAGNVTYISTPVITNDEQAPVIDISTSSITSTSVQFNIMMSDNLVSDIDYAYVLLKSGDTTPEGWDDVVATEEIRTTIKDTVPVVFENLEPNTEYVLYVVANDKLTNLNGTINNPNYSSVQQMTVRTSKHSVNVSDQTFLVKSGVSDSYTYDLMQLLTASNVNVSQMGNVTYSAVAYDGDILSNTGDMVVNGNVLTIPVKSNFDAGKEQYITVTIQSEHYEEITVDLIVKSVSKTPVTIDGVSVIDTTYNSEAQGYTGEIKWKDNGQACSVSNTKVEYEGINDTTYGPSEDAPVDAGDYKITFTVDDSNYEGTATYYYTIHKMDLSAEMLDTTWYIGANKASDLENSVVVNGQTYTVEVKNYSDKVEPKYEGTCSASEIGGYEASVSFKFIDNSYETNYKLPASMTLYWKIITKTQVALTGVSIADAVYNGESHGYTGTIEWKNGETVCDVANTTVEYVGINDTVYGPTADAPSNAGDYKVTFTVEDALYEGTQSYWFTIAKADLTSEMTNVAWYINGERIDGYTKTVVHNGSTYSVELKNYSEKLDVIYSGICSGAELGDYEAIANFEFKDSSDAMNYKLPTSTSLYWKISSKMQVSLSGITVGDVTYNGEAQGYTGSIEWKDGEEVCDVAGTKIEYSGIGSTTYGPSEVAPTNAGSYKVTFTVEDAEYEGTQSYWYAIEKADLNSEMADTKWYLDEKVVTGESASVMRDGQEHQISVKDYSQKVKSVYSGICNAVDCGEYTAIVDFEFEDTAYTDNYLIPNSMALDWSIVDKYTPDMSKVKWCYQQGDTIADYIEGTTQLTDNGMEYIVSVTGLPEGVVAEYSGTYKASVAGNYSATVTFRNIDDTKYHDPNPTTMSLNWSIVTPTSDPSDKPQTGEPGDNPQTPDQGDNPQVIAPEVGTSKEVGGQKYTVATTSSTGGTVQYSGPVNKNVTSVDIPATVVIDGQTYTVTMITANAFNGCKSMTSVKIGGNVTSIGTGAFKGCVKLKSVVIPASVTSIGANAFSGCKAMTKVTIGKNVKTIGNGAFSGCTKLSTVSMNTSAKLTKIGDKAFYKCTSLKKITIPKNVTTIGKSAFEGCKKLKTITIKSKKLKKVGSKAIKNIHKKATIKCPGKSYVKKYKKLFKSKTGYKKTMKIKK